MQIEEFPDPEVGEICYHPPIVFCGYYNQPEETRKAVSTEGILYTGDLGYFKQMDGYRALYLAGRKGISPDPKHQDRQNTTDIIG